MKKKISLFLLILLIVFLFFPMKVLCRVPFFTCTPLPSEEDNNTITRPYDIQPLLASIVELITSQDCFIKYKTGYEIESLDSLK